MKKLILLSAIIFGTLSVSAQKKWNYPPTPKIPVYDTIFGHVIKDDYRWMENSDDPKFVEWLQAQKKFTDSVLALIPGQKELEKDYRALKESFSGDYYPIQKSGDNWVYWHYTPDLRTQVMMRNTKKKTEKVLFDPEEIFKPIGYEVTSIQSFPSGKMLLVNTTKEGSEINVGRFYDIQSGKFLKDTIVGQGVTSAFEIDGQPFVAYRRSMNSNVRDANFFKDMQFSIYQVGSGAEPSPVFNPKDYPDLPQTGKNWNSFATNPNSPFVHLLYFFGDYDTIISLFGKKADLIKKDFRWKKLETPFFTSVEGSEFMLKDNYFFYPTNKSNPFGEVRRVDFTNPTEKGKIIFTPEDGWLIDRVTMSRDYLLIHTSKNALVSKLFKYHFKTEKISEIPTALKGIIRLSVANQQTNEGLITSRSWSRVSELSYFDIETDEIKPEFFTQALPKGIGANLVEEVVEVRSHDGAMVPLSIVYDKTRFKKDGSNILVLNGYGAFGTKRTPSFLGGYDPVFNRGVIYAVAHVRGGGEKGADWHKAGTLDRKPNSWKDFHACAEWLIQNKYTSSEKMFAAGASAGGILVGRAVTDRPDLYAGADIKVGMLNALRFDYTPNFGRGTRYPEFGSVHYEGDVAGLMAMDSYYQTRPGTSYPAQYITGGYNDPRVIIWQPAKYAAAMQASSTSGKPVLFDVQMDAGHFGRDGDDGVKDYVRNWAFILWQTGHPDFQPKE